MPAGDDLPPLREVIARHELGAKKSLGQHFLLDLNLTRRIARAAGPLADAIVYEVGPGPGGLTRALLAEGAKHVVAVERDERCLAALSEIETAFPGRLTIASADAMKVDEPQLLEPYTQGPQAKIVANLPYNVGSALLVKWLTSPVWPPFWSSLTLMFQREVAERLVAVPASAAYGRLSILAQWRSKPKILFDVSRSAFVPPPKVTSAVVHIVPLSSPVAPARLEDLEAVTAATFGQRRKMLRQSLKRLTGNAEQLLASAGLDPTSRPEQLSVTELAALARALREEKERAGAKD